MASYRIRTFEAQANNDVYLDVIVFPTGVTPPANANDTTGSVGHFTVILNANEVKQAQEMTGQQRSVYLKGLFEADQRISGIVNSEEAVVLLNEWYDLPITITL